MHPSVAPSGAPTTAAARADPADGIDHIAADGTVTFAEREMAVMKELLGYECLSMRLDDAPQ